MKIADKTTKILFVCAVLLLAGWALPARATEAEVEVELPELACPSWSPDGKYIAFCYTQQGMDTEVWIIQPDGSGLEQVAADAGRPRWSADSSTLYFLAGKTGKTRLWKKHLATGLEEQVSDKGGNPKISHDGKSVIVSVMRWPNWGMSVVTTATGQEENWLATKAYRAVWSPDDKEVAFLKEKNLWVRRRDGSQERKLTHYWLDYEFIGGLDWGAGGFIAFDRGGKIYKIRPDETGLTCIFKGAGQAKDPCWSPDGKRLAFVYTTDDFPALYVMKADGSSPTRITKAVLTPTFSPDDEAYKGEAKVAILCETPGVTIRYTTDYKDPTETSPLYTGQIPLNRSLAIKAKAWKKGYVASGVQWANYRIPTPTFSPIGGDYHCHQMVTISCAIKGAEIRYTTDETYPNEFSSLYRGPIPINRNMVIVAQAWKKDWTESEPAVGIFNLKVPTPGFNPKGGNSQSPQLVTISCADKEATIRFTTDGSEPTEASAVYAEPIFIGRSMTLKAKAWKLDWLASETRCSEYQISSP